jgi:hypothetical protein
VLYKHWSMRFQQIREPYHTKNDEVKEWKENMLNNSSIYCRSKTKFLFKILENFDDADLQRNAAEVNCTFSTDLMRRVRFKAHLKERSIFQVRQNRLQVLSCQNGLSSSALIASIWTSEVHSSLVLCTRSGVSVCAVVCSSLNSLLGIRRLCNVWARFGYSGIAD